MKTTTALKRLAIVGAMALLATATEAKDKPRIQIQVIETKTSERVFQYTTPGTASQSTTSCTDNATAFGGPGLATANGSSNCTTTTTPGRPAVTRTGSIPQVFVRAIMPDGRHVTVWCQAGFRSCNPLSPGSYGATQDGNSLWIYGTEFSGKERKTKYRYQGDWQ